MLSEQLRKLSDQNNYGSLIRFIEDSCEPEAGIGKNNVTINLFHKEELYLTKVTLLSELTNARNNKINHENFIKNIFSNIERITGLKITLQHLNRDSSYGKAEVQLLIEW